MAVEQKMPIPYRSHPPLAGMPPAAQIQLVPAQHHPRPSAKLGARAPLCLAFIATRNYLPFAQVLAKSFRQHHQSVPVFLLVPDGKAATKGCFPEARYFFWTIWVWKMQAGSCEIYGKRVLQRAKASLPKILGGWADRAIYLDTDIAVFSPLTELVKGLDVASLVLIPHMFAPFPCPERFWVRPNTADVFNSGLINAGCFAIRLRECDELLRSGINIIPRPAHSSCRLATRQINNTSTGP